MPLQVATMAKSFFSRQNRFRYGKINFIAAKLISPRQNQFHHGEINFIHRTINFTIGKINFTHDKINFAHNKVISTLGKINFITAKSFSFTAKWISPQQNHFGYLAHVTLARKVPWESIQYGKVPRGSMTQHVLLKLWT